MPALPANLFRRFLPWWLGGLTLIAGCESAPRNMAAVRAYYEYDFTSAREALRADAELRNDERVILNNLRLGVAALADGDDVEAERAFTRVFEFLSTAGLNEDRTTAAVLLHEGVRIWKGEPFEQALAYAAISSFYATRGDWENMRAAATNSIFRLTDFGSDQNRKPTQADLVRRESERPGYLETGYNAVDTNFALGFLLQAIGSDLSGLGGADPQFDAAIRINADLKPMIETLRAREYDTLLLIDYGKGPTKYAYGPDDALSRFAPQDDAGAEVVIQADGERLARFDAVCDVNRMAIDHRWNNLEDVRKAKSAIGNVLVAGGLGAVVIGGQHDSKEAQIAGLAAILAGALTKSGAKADTRYMEFAPSEVFMVPLRLNQIRDVRVAVGSRHDRTVMTLPDLQPGEIGNPRVTYLRLHGRDSREPAWLAAEDRKYGNDFSGVQPGDYPWVLGGHDVSTPSPEVFAAYQHGGRLREAISSDLDDLYRHEDILVGSGAETRPNERKNPSFRHVLEGGTGLFTPHPYSMGYKRLMFSSFPPYRLKSEIGHRLRDMIAMP